MFKKDIYDLLAEDVDRISFGFPKSYFRLDKKLLKKIFTPEHAKVFVQMKQGYVTAKQHAEQNNISEAEAKAHLDAMANKGLIFRRHRGENDEYHKHPFVMGFLEFQVNNPDTSWLLATSLYMITSKFGKRMSQTMPFYRTVPMHKEFLEGSKIMPYDDIEAILDKHTRFGVAPCMCRKMQRLDPKFKCIHPSETCIVTDDYATFYIETGLGREITKEEALAILREGENDGRVINVTNSQDGENICSCCACGCGILTLRTRYPGPANDLWSNHYSEVDLSKCVKCGLCVKKCPFNYIKMTKEGIEIDQKHCLGCGLCIAACHQKAIVLKHKPNLYTPPETYDGAIEIWQNITKKDYNKYK